MRFLFTLPYYEWTGPAEPLAQLAQDLEVRGHQVTIWVEGKRSGDLFQRLEALDLQVESPLELSRKSTPLGVMRDLREAGELMKGRFDVAVAHMSADQLVLCQSRRVHGVPVFRYAQNQASLNSSSSRRWLLRQADGYFVPSPQHRDHLCERFRILPSRCEILGGAVDLDAFHLGESRSTRDRWGCKPEHLVAVCVSRMKEERRHGMLLKAFAEAVKQRPELRLILVGRGEYQETLKVLVGDLGLNHCVHFPGYAKGNEVCQAFQAADLSIWLAEGNDGTCRAIGQSLACGRPVLGSRIGAIAAAIDPLRTGWLVGPDDEAALAKTLAGLPSHDALPKPEDLRKVAEHQWSRQHRCDQFASSVEHLLS